MLALSPMFILLAPPSELSNPTLQDTWQSSGWLSLKFALLNYQSFLNSLNNTLSTASTIAFRTSPTTCNISSPYTKRKKATTKLKHSALWLSTCKTLSKLLSRKSAILRQLRFSSKKRRRKNTNSKSLLIGESIWTLSTSVIFLRELSKDLFSFTTIQRR